MGEAGEEIHGRSSEAVEGGRRIKYVTTCDRRGGASGGGAIEKYSRETRLQASDC